MKILSQTGLFVLLFFLSVPCSATAAETNRLNVLFLIADDLNCALGCYGNALAKTPNLDRLAARGLLFEHAYCTHPVCGPARNSLLTGLHPNSTGILLNSQIFRQTIPEQVSLPQAFRQQGFFVARIGKLFHYNVPDSVGTDGHDDPASWELQLNPAGVDRTEEIPRVFSIQPGHFGATLSWYASPKSDAQHTDGLLAADAEWVLERCARQRDRPFFVAVGFFRPHTPYDAPKSPYFDEHPEAEMPLVTNVEEDQADIPAAALASRKPEEKNLTDDLRRKAIQGYYASISFMDAQVGRVVAALDRLGLADNTIIVFTSDHGYHMGEHGLWQKRSLFEEGARVPLLMVVPGITSAGAVAKSPVSHVDIYPTLAGLCGVKTPANLQGQSLVPMLKDSTFVGRGWAVTQVMRGKNPANCYFGYSLRTERWRYTEWDEGRAGHELYDHNNDPRELTNLADNPAHKDTIVELSQKLHAAIRSTFPPSGKTPELKKETWAPKLVD